MGKIRHVTMGDETKEKEQKQKAESRRQTKASKKEKPDESVVSDDEKKRTKPNQPPKNSKGKSTKQALHGSHKNGRKNKLYPLTDAVSLVKQTSLTKFDGTVELHINLNPLALSEKGDSPRGEAGKKDLRVTVNLPHSSGKPSKSPSLTKP